MNQYTLRQKSKSSDLKVICFQIKEDLLQTLSHLNQSRQDIYSFFNSQCKELEFGSLKEDAEFLVNQRAEMSKSAKCTQEEWKFLDASISLLLKHKLKFIEKNQVIVLFLQQYKGEAHTSNSINKKLIENMDQVRLSLFQYFNSISDE